MKEIWKGCIAGSEKARERSLEALKQQWVKRVRTEPADSDTIMWAAFLSMVRETIIESLKTMCGLQIKINISDDNLYCRIRAPLKLIELQAAVDDYKLQYRGEIDPGSEQFWNREINRLVLPDDDEEERDSKIKGMMVKKVPVEINEESIAYTRAESLERLERLYKCKKINSTELGINAKLEDSTMLSRRVHALERVVDRVPVWNQYPAFGEYTTLPHLRYLFNVYPSTRGDSFFRTKDRLYLLKSLVDRYYDFRHLEDAGLVVFLTPLHDANRGERLTIEVLFKIEMAVEPLRSHSSRSELSLSLIDCNVWLTFWFLL